MPENTHTIKISNSGTRTQVRKRALDVFLKEKPGTGKEEKASRYTYYVESLSDGRRIFLRRPGALKKGFDFVIHVENTDFKRANQKRYRTNPSHEDLYIDLRQKRRVNPRKYKKLYALLESVYLCNSVKLIEITQLTFDSGHSVDLILGVFKWFFIEQDIRDWNYSGRAMCFSGIPKP